MRWHEVGYATVCMHLSGDVYVIELLDGDVLGHARTRCVVAPKIEMCLQMRVKSKVQCTGHQESWGNKRSILLENLKAAQVSTHEKNVEIPGLIAEGKGSVMITETYEALHYGKADSRLYAAYIDAPLTPKNQLGFMIATDDADYSRVMGFVREMLDSRGALKQTSDKW